MTLRLRKLVCGAQTGADRAALDVALDHGLEIGGWVPRGRLAEDGVIPARYSGLRETESADAAKPLLHLDLTTLTLADAAHRLRQWLDAVDPEVLNVAGPRASEDPRIAAAVTTLLRDSLSSD